LGEIGFGSVPIFKKQKTQLPVLKLSPHKIALFRQCKLQYKLQCIDKLGEQYGRPRPYYTMGNHVHATLCDLFSLMPIEKRTVETAKSLLRKNWRRYRIGFRNKADEKRWADRALAEVTRFVEEQDTTVTPLMLERPVEARIVDGLVLRGRVDRVDKLQDGTLHIIDYKTGIVPENTDWTQLELHAIILSHCTCNTVVRISFFYLLSGEIASKRVHEEDLSRAKWDLLSVANRIRRERNYPPNPGIACAGCDFAAICPAKHDGWVETGLTELPLWRDSSDASTTD